MITRLPLSAASFVVVLTAYWLYTLLAVPLIEPSARLVVAASDSDGPHADVSNPYQALLAQHFPAEHWALKSPKVLVSPQAMLLLSHWRSLDDRRVELVPCAMILFPDKGLDDAAATSAPIILEAPEGALLTFDEGFDLARAKLGKLVCGELRGLITIRSDMDQPGADDDLRITTRDVQMRESRVWTDADVQFRLGKNHGQGSCLEIRLLPAPVDGSDRAGGVNVGGVHWFELKKRVRAHLDLGDIDLLPGSNTSPDAARRAEANAAARATSDSDTQPPVRITSAGPFHFDLRRRTATFEDQVDVHRLRADDVSDTLSCQLLSVQFADSGPRPGGSETAAGAAGRGDTVSPPAVRAIVAEGNPVKISSPATRGQARCQRLEYQPSNVPGGLPLVKAAGPGWLETIAGNEPGQRFRATWGRQLALRRHEGEPVVSMWGQPTLTMDGADTLTADAMHLYLQETAEQATDPGRPSFVPDRMVAVSDVPGTRNVRIDSRPLTGEVERLQIWIVRQDAAAHGAGELARQDHASTGGDDGLPRERQQRSTAVYDVRGDVLSLELAMAESDPKVANLTIDGDVRFRETRTAQPNEQPLKVVGHWLRVDDADTPATRVTVRGAPASVEARGLGLRGREIELRQGDNRLWIDGPGQMSLPVSGDLEEGLRGLQRPPGRPDDRSATRASSPQTSARDTLTVSWQGRMNFDGRTFQCEKSVVARDNLRWLRTESLVVTLSEAVRFDQSVDTTGIVVQEILCRQGVALQNRSFELQKLVSVDRMEAQDLLINQMTGQIHAGGHGRVTSVRMGNNNPLAPPPAVAPDAEPADGQGEQLQCLRVDFARAAEGNLHQRRLTFHGQVRAVRGPVDRWDAQLEPDGPVGPDTVRLQSNTLTVTQTGPGSDGQDTLELEARGNALVEGQSFVARAERMTYAQVKDLIILEGTSRADARLWRQRQVGGPQPEVAARKIFYWLTVGRVELESAKRLNLSSMPDSQLPEEAASPRAQAAPR